MTAPVVRCPVCAQAHTTCGPRTTVQPVDIIRERSNSSMGLKVYDVPQRDGSVAQLKLNEEDAKRLGVLPTKPAEQPATKTRAAGNKARTAGDK